MKVVINRCYGGFSLSMAGVKRYCELIGKKVYFYTQTKYSFRDGVDEYRRVSAAEKEPFLYHSLLTDCGESCCNPFDNNPESFYEGDLERNDPKLVQVVEELGQKASGNCAQLSIVEIPDGIDWCIDEYDGLETVEEQHRSWC